jgi:catechol 2,3-dioxygenase-like lactoylglutathione lyase family enzyme
MAVPVTAIMIGVEDLARSKKFYGEGLGRKIAQDHPNFVSFDLGAGSSSLALYERAAAAQDAGVSSRDPDSEESHSTSSSRCGKLWTR